jgi:hypothetical protein
MPSKPSISKHSTLVELKAFVRKHKLNHPSIKLGMKKAEMLDALDKLGHINTEPRPKKEAPKKEAPKAKTPPPTKPKFKVDQSKQPKQTPSKIKMSYKPPLNTKKIEEGSKYIKTYKTGLRDFAEIDLGKKVKENIRYPVYMYNGFDYDKDGSVEIFYFIHGEQKEDYIIDLAHLSIEDIKMKKNGMARANYKKLWSRSGNWYEKMGE